MGFKNILPIHASPLRAASLLSDQHVKQLCEEVPQFLAVSLFHGKNVRMANHLLLDEPKLRDNAWTIWLSQNQRNWDWGCCFAEALTRTHQMRFKESHGNDSVINRGLSRHRVTMGVVIVPSFPLLIKSEDKPAYGFPVYDERWKKAFYESFAIESGVRAYQEYYRKFHMKLPGGIPVTHNGFLYEEALRDGRLGPLEKGSYFSYWQKQLQKDTSVAEDGGSGIGPS